MHSVKNYLQRCSTEKLYRIIYAYLYEKDSVTDERLVLDIFDILRARKAHFPEGVPDELVLKWEKMHFC